MFQIQTVSSGLLKAWQPKPASAEMASALQTKLFGDILFWIDSQIQVVFSMTSRIACATPLNSVQPGLFLPNQHWLVKETWCMQSIRENHIHLEAKNILAGVKTGVLIRTAF